MPDMPQGGAPAPAPAQDPSQGQPDPGQGGGGIADAIASVDATVNKIAQAVASNDKVSDDVKAAWQDALAALRKAEQALVSMVGGDQEDAQDGGDDEEAEGEGPTSMQQGGNKGAVPMTHQNMRG